METGKLMDEIDLMLQTSKVGTMSTSDDGKDSEYMTFYIKDYALYTETEKNSAIMRFIEQNPFVNITLGGDEESDNYLEIVGEVEVVDDDMVMLKVVVQKVKLVGEQGVHSTE